MDQLTRVKNPATNDGESTRVVMADDRPASGRAGERSGNPGMLVGRTMAPVDRLTHSRHLLLVVVLPADQIAMEPLYSADTGVANLSGQDFVVPLSREVHIFANGLHRDIGRPHQIDGFI